MVELWLSLMWECGFPLRTNLVHKLLLSNDEFICTDPNASSFVQFLLGTLFKKSTNVTGPAELDLIDMGLSTLVTYSIKESQIISEDFANR